MNEDGLSQPQTNQSSQMPYSQTGYQSPPSIEEQALLSKIITINSIGILTPISPIQYIIQARSIEKLIKHFHGITTTSEVIGIKPIDMVSIDEGIFFGSVTIIHNDKSTITIDKITKKDALTVKSFFEDVIIYQRKNIVNITGD